MNYPNERRIECLSDYMECISTDELRNYLQLHKHELVNNPRPFADYMRSKFKMKRILQQDVFIAADISDKYGYKLISGEKHTVARDTILRICIAAHFTLEETQEALILYGMAPLYSKISRDIVFIVAIENKIYDLYQINELLSECKQPSLFKESE